MRQSQTLIYLPTTWLCYLQDSIIPWLKGLCSAVLVVLEQRCPRPLISFYRRGAGSQHNRCALLAFPTVKPGFYFLLL